LSLTIRQTIAELLRQKEHTAKELALILALKPREVREHLEHLRKSLKKSLLVRPARCRDCAFVFTGRSRLDQPGRCPCCRKQRLEGPWLKVAE
jgi:predicted Zn-ribbon and HTH transcriptional regulator